MSINPPTAVQQCQQHHSRKLRRARAAAIIGISLAGLVACGSDSTERATTTPATTAPATSTTTSPPTTSTTTAPDQRPTQPVDETVGAEGAQVHIRCHGQGDTTVVLISGFEAASESWNAIEPALSLFTRVCTYDRPGTGLSDPPATVETFETQARDLRALLATIGEPGPFVVVGQSFGGAEAATFASQFREDVAGLVLIDASPTNWPSTLCDVADDGSAAAQIVRGLCNSWSDPTANGEHLDVLSAFDEVSTIASLGSLPLTVITAVDREMPAGLSTDELARLTQAWDLGQQVWQQLSSNSRLVSVADTGHQIQIDQPQLVIDEITRLVS